MSRISSALLGLYDAAVFYGGLVLFGLTCLIWSPCAIVLLLLPRRLASWIGRRVIMLSFRCFLAGLTLSRRFRFDLHALDALREEGPLIIAPNHPSLLDAVIVISRLPNVACVMKAALIHSAFLGAGARLAYYIPNDSLRKMITLAIDDLRRGSQLLLFPEGTRTVTPPINPLTGSIGIIACRTGIAVQTVIIETDSPYLRKGWPLYRKPILPIAYRIRLGRRFAAPEDTHTLIDELENYFKQEIGGRQASMASSISHHSSALVTDSASSTRAA